jgi:NitT/TauT family transport system ATP-binding protein
VIFQEANLLLWRNLGQNIDFPFEIIHERPDQARVAGLVDATGLSGFEGAMPRELSGGMGALVSS